ncbi:MAG: hypothetical protein DMG71_13210 [Acidobacteria bacterium]|nr:MAG: hypothetical protein DMG71_13210 [Acidobacteriota bacterium]
MSYELVFNVFLGMLALLGFALLIMFWRVFRNENTIHPIYRPYVSPADSESSTASAVACPQGNTLAKRRDTDE